MTSVFQTPALARLGVLLVLCSFLITGCGLCSRVDESSSASSSAESIAAHIPGDAPYVLFLGSWKDIRDSAQLINANFGADIAMEGAALDFKRRFGVDLLTLEGLNKLGVREDQGLAVATYGRSKVLILPLETPSLFEKYVDGLAQKEWKAAPQPLVKKVGEHEIKLWLRADANGGAPKTADKNNLVFAYVLKGKTALLFPGNSLMTNRGDAEVALTRALKMTREKSLAVEQDFATLKTELGQEHPMLLLVDLPTEIRASAAELQNKPQAKEEMDNLNAVANDLGRMGVGFRPSRGDFKAKGLVLARGELLQNLKVATKGTGPVSGTLKGSVAPDAGVLLKLSVDPEKALSEYLKYAGSESAYEFKQSNASLQKNVGLDLQKDLLPLLDGHVVVTLYKAHGLFGPSASLSSLFTKGETALSLGLRDRAKVAATLDQMAQSMGALMSREENNGVVVYTLSLLKLRMALGKDSLSLAGRELSDEKLIKTAQGSFQEHGASMKTAGAGALLQSQDSSGLLVNARALADAMGMLKGGVAPFLKPFDVWSLVFHVGDKGPVFDLTMKFKEKDPSAGGSQKNK